MKQFKLVLPKTRAEDFAKYCHEQKIKVVLSWSEGGDFFALKIHCICQAEDSAVADLMTKEWKSLVITS